MLPGNPSSVLRNPGQNTGFIPRALIGQRLLTGQGVRMQDSMHTCAHLGARPSQTPAAALPIPDAAKARQARFPEWGMQRLTVTLYGVMSPVWVHSFRSGHLPRGGMRLQYQTQHKNLVQPLPKDTGNAGRPRTHAVLKL